MAEVLRALTLWENIPSGSKVPDIVNVLVETPKGSNNRYTYDRKSGAFRLEGVLPQSLPVADVGVIPQSLFDDGFPLSVAVLTGEPTFPGCLVEARPIGLLRILENKVYRDKVLAVPLKDPRYEDMVDFKDVDKNTLAVVAHFFAHSRGLEGAKVEIAGWTGSDAARKAVEHSVNVYKKRKD